jgi:hypothetical protein
MRTEKTVFIPGKAVLFFSVIPAEASHFRHSRENGNPSWRPLRWIPACAGDDGLSFGIEFTIRFDMN